MDLAEVDGVGPDSELTLVEDPYTEKDARLHLLRVRDLVGAAGDRADAVHGIEAGLSLHDFIAQAGEDAALTNGSSSREPQKHALSNYNIGSEGSIKALLPPSQEAAPKPIKAISLSPWNPPPYHLRSKGHLLYLLLTTNEGEQYQITAHVSGFFVSKSSNSKFDPFPRATPKNVQAHSLLTLIARLSPAFDPQFKALQAYNARRDALSSFQLANAIPASPWVVSSSHVALNTHVSDITRTQETYLLTGADNAETLRDWNEEFQTTRELPRETVQDRVFRERVTSKLFADYNEAATQGAVLIARGEVAALNPTEPEDAQIFVYNNVFYSFGADGVGTFTQEGGDEAARAATGKDVMGVKAVNQLDVPGLSTPGTVIVDYLGKRIVGQSIVPGIFKQREPGEQQIDYGGVEGKEVVAENDAFPPLFKKLSSAMRVKSHAVWDKEGKKHELEASVETKGLLGTDGRRYVLDLYRITPLDINWIEKSWDSPSDGLEKYPHRMTVLRPELVDAYWRMKLREYIRSKLPTVDDKSASKAIESEKKTDDDTEGKDGEAERKAAEQEKVDISDFHFALNPDAFSGQQPQSEGEQAEWARDESEVRAVSDWLSSEAMPRLIKDLQESEVSFPMDGQSLTALLHKRGINVRYLGAIAGLASTPEPRMTALKILAERAMITRAFKHLANRHLKSLPATFGPAAVAHMLNCLIGFKHNANPQAETDEELRSLYAAETFAFEKLTPQQVHEKVAAEVSLRYRYRLASSWADDLKPAQTLRDIALKFGLQLIAREYNFEKSATNGTAESNGHHLAPPATNGNTSSTSKKTKKKGRDASPAPQASPAVALPLQTFHADDIVNITPVIKEASPRSVLAEEALEAGRISLAQNQKDLGQELLLESLSLHEQIYGILHADVARVYYQLSSHFFGLEDKTMAVELARKAVIISERTLGVDHNETVLAYLNLSLFEHAVGNTGMALVYARHALDLWKVVYGQKHPDAVTTMNNVAVMLQNMKLYHDSRDWFEQSLKICSEIYGAESVNTATLLFQLAQALALDQDSHGAVDKMRQSYKIFSAKLGPEDRNTKEAETWLTQLTQNAVAVAKHAKDIQMRRMQRLGNSARLAPGISLPSGQRPLLEPQSDAMTRAAGGGLDERSVEELLRYIEGGETAKTSTPKKKPAHPKRRQKVA